jgi:hypothetical protein
MKKLIYITTVLSTVFTVLQVSAMATQQQQETQRKLGLIQHITPIARLAPKVKLRLLLALLPQIQVQHIDQMLAMYRASGALQNPDLLKKLFIDLKSQALASAQVVPQQTKTLLATIQTRLNQALATITQHLRPEEKAGLVLYLVHTLSPETLQKAQLPINVKNTLTELKTQVSAFKQAIQNKYAPHLKEEIAKHEQEILSQTEADTV